LGWGCLLVVRVFSHSLSKPRGIRAARQLKVHRRIEKWSDKQYKKSHLGTALKANPFGGSSHAKGIVLEKLYVFLLSIFPLCSQFLQRHWG